MCENVIINVSNRDLNKCTSTFVYSVSIMALNGDRFQIRIVKDKFEASLVNEDDVKLAEYLDSFEELNKFFTLMGTVFGFVSKDLKAKIEILKKFHEESKENFSSVRTMIEYEKNNELLNKKGYVSGARTLLRLHRGLDFIRLFLDKLGNLKNEENASSICREAYDQTLSKHHPFIIRKGAQVAIYALPTRAVLLQRVCGDEETIQEAISLLPKTLEITSLVFNRLENLYTIYDLHELP
ncbi:ceramide-1-phosphate transfer protein [Diorhabda carinulata]|uniref:ceramide-1-phosphate transfer protein n=1 Tax=Diorhabda carinulata TaxID=1163345 RepID=UPI0025A0C4A0|nr:ceramide-1-phosphate transfer protein [Diorhabda carinulata]